MNKILFSFLTLLLSFAWTISSFAACPAGVYSAGDFADPCGNPTNKKTCCVDNNNNTSTTPKRFVLYNAGTSISSAVISNGACSPANGLAVPGFTALEITNFLNHKPACLTTALAAANTTWLGLIDNNWSTAGNWSNNTVPSTTDVVYFNRICGDLGGTTNCTSINIDVDIDVKGIVVEDVRSGGSASAITLTVASGKNVTIRSSGFTDTSSASSSYSPTATVTTPASSIFDGTLAATVNLSTYSGALTLNSLNFKTSTAGTNTFSAVTIQGGTFTVGTSTVAINGALTLSSGTYTSTGTDNFNSSVSVSGGTITTGTLTQKGGSVTISAGTWNLAGSKTSKFNDDASSTNNVYISGTGKLLPSTATTSTVNFNSTNTSTINPGTRGALDIESGSAATFATSASTATSIVTVTGGLYISGSGAGYYNVGTDNFNNKVTITTSGKIATGTLNQTGGAVVVNGTWTLSSGTSNFNNDGLSGVTVSGGSIAPVASSTVNFKSTLGISAGTFGQASPVASTTVTVTGALTVSGTGSYYSTGTDNFNNSVTFSSSGAMQTGTLTQTGGAVSLSGGGTWTLSAGTSIFNNDGANGVSISSSSVLKPVASSTVNFKFTLGISSGAFGQSVPVVSTTVTVTGAMTVSGTGNYYSAGIDNFNNSVTFSSSGTIKTGTLTQQGGNVTISGGGGWTLSAGTSIFNNDSSATNYVLISNGDLFYTTGATIYFKSTLSSGSSSNSSFTVNSSGNFGSSSLKAATITLSGGLTVTGASATFYGNTGSFYIAGDMYITGAATRDFSASDLNFNGGTQTFTSTSTSIIGNSLIITYTGSSQTKTINVASFSLDITGTALSVTSGGTANAVTVSQAISIPNGNMIISSTAGGLTLTNNASITLSSTTSPNGSVTLNPTGTLALGGTGLLSLSGSLISNDASAGGNISGTMPITMTAGYTPVSLSLGTSGKVGTSGAFTVDTSIANIVNLTTTFGKIDSASPAQTLTVNQGTLELTTGCSGSTCTLSVYNITINTGGKLHCGTKGIYSKAGAGTLTLNGTGIIDCVQYPFSWIGSAGNHNWNTASNWSGGVVPSSTSIAVFDKDFCNSSGSTEANCQVNVDTGTNSIAGLYMLANYTCVTPANCTITQSADLTIGTSGIYHQSGIINGGASSRVLYLAGDLTLASAGAYVGNTGTFAFTTTTARTYDFSTYSPTFYGVTFATAGGITTTLVGTMTVNGTLTLGATGSVGTLAGGTISAKGNVAINNYGYNGSTTLVDLAGTGAQTVSASGTTNNIPKFSISNASASNITFNSNATYIFNDLYTHTGAATVVYSSTPTIQFNKTGTYTNTFNNDQFYNVNFLPTATTTLTSSGTAKIYGTLVVNPSAGTCTMTGGTWSYLGTGGNASGDIQFNGTIGCGGTTSIAIASTSGSVKVVDASGADIPGFSVTANTPTAITFASGSTLPVSSTYAYTGNAGLTATGSTLQFIGTSQSITGGSVAYDTVKFSPPSNTTYTLTGNLNVGVAMTLNSTASTLTCTGGTVNMQLSSTVDVGNNGCTGTTLLQLSGNAAQSITCSAGTCNTPALTISNSGVGNITFPSGTLVVNGVYTYSSTTAPLVANAGTVKFNNSSASTLEPGTGTYYIVNFNGSGTVTMSATNPLKISNNLTLSGNTPFTAETGTIKLTGGASQSITCSTSPCILPNFEVATSSGTVTFPTGKTLSVYGTYNYTGAATLSAGTSTLQLCDSTSNTINPGSGTYGNVDFNGTGAITLTGYTLTMNNALSFSKAISITGGTISTSGTSITFNSGGSGSGTLALTVTGASTMTISRTTASTDYGFTGALTLGKSTTFGSSFTLSAVPISVSSGTINFSNTFNDTGNDLTVTSASVNINGTSGRTVTFRNLILGSSTYNTTFSGSGGVLTISTGGTGCTAGTYTGTFSQNSHSMCGGTINY